MDILAGAECFKKSLVLGIVGQNPEVDLGIVSGYKNMTPFRYECLPDALSLLCPDGNILQVGAAAGKPPRGGNRLVERGMHPACFRVDQSGQFLHIGGLQLAQVPVDQYCLGQFMK